MNKDAFGQKEHSIPLQINCIYIYIFISIFVIVLMKIMICVYESDCYVLSSL